MKLAIGVASAGRYATLHNLIKYFPSLNNLVPVFLCTPNKNLDLGFSTGLDISVLFAQKTGLCYQRNIILESAKDFDFLVFFDDDFLPRWDYLENLDRLLSKGGNNIGILTGFVIADGITKGGFSFSNGIQYLDESRNTPLPSVLSPVFNGYGCNMVVNMKLVRKHNLRFEERLPLYGWLEDVEFSLQIKPIGDVVRAGNCVGVHLGAPEGRQGARRLGYSQIANPHFICLKHRLATNFFVRQTAGRFLMNFIGACRGNKIRKERLIGNILALHHLAGKRINPDYILQIPA